MKPIKQFNLLIIIASVTLVLGCSTHKIPGFIERTTTAIVVQVYVEQNETKVDVVGLPDHSCIKGDPFRRLTVPKEMQSIHIGDRVTIEILYQIDQSGSKDPSCGEPFMARIISKK